LRALNLLDLLFSCKNKGKIGKTAKTLAWFVDNREKATLNAQNGSMKS